MRPTTTLLVATEIHQATGEPEVGCLPVTDTAAAFLAENEGEVIAAVFDLLHDAAESVDVGGGAAPLVRFRLA